MRRISEVILEEGLNEKILDTTACGIWWCCAKSLSRVRLFATLWTVAGQASLSMGFSRQESWSGLPFPSPDDLPDPGLDLSTPEFQADSLPSEPPRLSKELPPSSGAGGKE